MGKFVFLTGYYLPKPGATGLCVHQLAKEAAKRGHDVTTICYADGDEQRVFDGVKIIKIKTPAFLQENMTASPIQKKINHLKSMFSKLVHIRKYPLRSLMLVNRYEEALEQEIHSNVHVAIIASVNPLEAVVAADRVKKKYPQTTRSVYYCADTLSNEKGDDGILSAEYRTECGIKWEKYLFESFDKVLIMECHKDHYFSDDFSSLKNKMEIVNFPLFSRMEISEKESANDYVRLTYAGTLYRKLRNPQYLCDMLVQLSGKMKICASFLGSGDCDDILKECQEKSNGAIELLGMQTHEDAMKYIGDADVLLSIGNTESPMAPSKIYEYMSTGKPIIHVYTYDKDPCLAPLQKYGNALLLKEGEENGCDRICGFVEERKKLPFSEVEKKFDLSTPAYTVNLLEKM